MNRPLASIALALGLALPTLALGQAPPDPGRLFPFEAPITVPEGAGLVRLPLPAGVLERASAGLGDVRIYDPSGRERPYRIESGRAPSTPTVHAVTPIEVSRRIETGGSLAPIWREHFVLTAPADPLAVRWRLVLDASAPRFVRDVVVYALAGEERIEVARGTVFRLVGPDRERRFVDLAPFADGGRLEVQLRGEGGYLEPTVRLAALREPIAPPALVVGLEELSRTQADGRTVIEVARPAGLAPDRLRVATETGHFARDVRVLDLSAGRPPRELGRAMLFRVRELAGAEHVEVELGRAVGDRLRVEIDDGDSPTLDALRLEAEVGQPSLVFDPAAGLPQGVARAPLVLRFGGGRVRAPRYDVARLAGTDLADRLRIAALPVAELGPIGEHAGFDAGPALGFAMRPGRAPDASRYTHVATLRVEGATEGLSRVRLPPSVLAAAREDLADVRVVDADGAQWPYLRGAEASDAIALSVGAPTARESRSVYALGLPVARASIDGIELSSRAPYVARAFELHGVDGAGARVMLARGRLERDPHEARPLVIRFAPRRVERLELEVVDGSDAPLAFERAEASLPSPTFYLAAPDGEYRVLAGDAEAEPPRYELEAARELALSVQATDAQVGEAGPNAARVEPPWWSAENASGLVVWAVLLLAVLFLGLLTLRVVRQSAVAREAPPASAPPADAPAAQGEGGEPPPPPPLEF